MGFIWGFCLGFIFLFICLEITGLGLFFTLVNSWALFDYVSLLIEILVVVVFMIRISCRVKDYQVCGRDSFKGIDSAVAIVCFFFFFFVLREVEWVSIFFLRLH